MRGSAASRQLAKLKDVNGRRQEELKRLQQWCQAASATAGERGVRGLFPDGVFFGVELALVCLTYERVSASTLRKLARRVHRETQRYFGASPSALEDV